MDVLDNIFKADDIRGLSPKELSPTIVLKIGQALADFLDNGVVAVGRDMRNDSAELAKALINGLVKQGREVVDLGLVTSDMIYFAVGRFNLAGGAMVTASHNPGQYNGIKLTGRGVVPIGVDTGLLSIKEAVRADNFKPAALVSKVTQRDIAEEWVNFALELAGKINPLNVGIDTGNGMAGRIVPVLRQKTSLVIMGLYLDLDGDFPNHVANPLIVDNLRDLIQLVRDKQLDLGIAFDGDGDRAFFIDETGEPVMASRLGALLATHFLQQHPGATILYNAVCSRIVPETIEANGGKAIRTKVGHSFIKEKMRETGAVFACEHSGHFYFKDNFHADSGLIAALTTLALVSQSRQLLSKLIQPFLKYYDSGEINVEVSDFGPIASRLKQEFSDGQIDELDGLTVNYPEWWFNIRPSNTEPVVRINVEASDQKLLESHTNDIINIIKNS